MSKQLKCNISNCKQYSRNNRDRHKDFKVIFYTDLLDTIHCYFTHSFDIGFRMRYSHLTQIYHQSYENKNQQENNLIENEQELDDYDILKGYTDGERMRKFNSLKRQLLRDVRVVTQMKVWCVILSNFCTKTRAKQ